MVFRSQQPLLSSAWSCSFWSLEFGDVIVALTTGVNGESLAVVLIAFGIGVVSFISHWDLLDWHSVSRPEFKVKCEGTEHRVIASSRALGGRGLACWQCSCRQGSCRQGSCIITHLKLGICFARFVLTYLYIGLMLRTPCEYARQVPAWNQAFALQECRHNITRNRGHQGKI